MQQTQTISRQKIHITLMKIAVAVCLLTLSAKIKIPFHPVPMTMQVAAFMVIAGLGGLRFGTVSFAAYLTVGALGVPVFAGTPEKGLGLIYLLGPTGGYLIGFLVSAGLIGWAVDRFGKTSVWMSMPFGLILSYAFGILWLSRFVPSDQLLILGVFPFLLGDVLKVILAAVLVTLAPAKICQWIK